MPRLRSTVTGAVMTVSGKVAARLGSGWVDADAVQRNSEPDKSWKVDELKAYAAEKDIYVSDAKNKGEILEAIANADESGNQGDGDPDGNDD